MTRFNLLTGSALAACVMAVGGLASAQDLREYNIPAGALRDALNAFAAQSDQQIFASGELVAGLRSPGLRGRHTPAAALDALLRGSGLTWSQSRPGVYVVQRAAVTAAVEPDATELGEVIVTGSLLGSSGELASPVVMLDRDELDRRGFATVAEALTDLPQNYSGSGTPAALLSYADPAGSNSVASTGVNLRGLGADATLVLVNGRRLAGTGSRGEFVDVSALPSAAVERVDVLLDGASALYGSDAVAGVVNVIMRRSLDGQESRVRIGAAHGGAEDLSVSHLVGTTWDGGGGYLSWEYQRTNPLSASDRPFTADGDLRPFGGSDRRLVYSSPGNILAYDPGVGGYVSAWAIRPIAGGTAQGPADFAAGEANLQGQLEGVDLLPEIERHSVYGQVRQSIGERLELSADLRFSHRDFSFANAAPVTILQVSAANPHFVSPSGAGAHLIGYSFLGDLGTSRQAGTSRSLGLTAGADYNLGAGWSLEGYLAWAEERGEKRTSGLVNAAFLNEALGNTPDNPATAFSAAQDGWFNPFGSGAANSQAVLDFVGSGYSGALDRSRSQSANLLLQGAALTLPGGDLEVAIGAQWRKESFGARLSSFTSSVAPLETRSPSGDRTVTALFAEARVPLVGEANARPGLRRLEVSLAGRIEDYGDFGRTSNPKVGVVWSPVDALNLRASWGTSFRAPSLPQLYDATLAAPTFVARADGTSVLTLYRYGGNADLAPETAETWTVGGDYDGPGGLRVSLNYFDTRFTDRISQPVNEMLSEALTNPALSSFVQVIDPANDAADLALIRSFIDDPAYGYGALFPAESYGAILDARWVNAAEVRVRGLDVSASRPFVFGEHTLTLDGAASWLLDYETRLTASAPDESVLGRVGYPVRLRARAGGSWTWDVWTAGLHWSHVASYSDGAGDRIEAWNTADLQVGWAPVAGPLAGWRVLATVQNLFDADPPFHDSASGLGYDPGQADLLGRVASLQLIRRW
ncbi:TonB-dependent receptor [Brevundimonas diminuta]|nr:TonB-dependent receptor [Brevundimonas diminuta]QQB89568.1 TonB-dependent receptor [Brevundimonas diminuta]GEC00807.1 TonB-dependent receptor [Brevundimonas diminuta]